MKQAASPTETLEDNRNEIYALYDKGMKLEPEGKPELTFTQRMMLNRASHIITLRMHRRQRVQQQKRSKKLMLKLSKAISSKLLGPVNNEEVSYMGSFPVPQDQLQQLKVGQPIFIPHTAL